MKIKIEKIEPTHWNSCDVERLIIACRTNGYNPTYEQAEQLWVLYSDKFAAGWIKMYRDDNDYSIFNCVKEFIEQENPCMGGDDCL